MWGKKKQFGPSCCFFVFGISMNFFRLSFGKCRERIHQSEDLEHAVTENGIAVTSQFLSLVLLFSFPPSPRYASTFATAWIFLSHKAALSA